MSIETEINRISANVSDTLSAVSEMGGEVPEGATSDDMASGVRSIPVGAKIDDTTPSSTTTYSSQKIESEISKLNEANATQDKEIAKRAKDADLAAVAKSGSYTDLTNKPTIPIVPESLKNPNKLTFTGAVTAEYDGSSPVSVEIPSGGGSSYELPIANATQLGGVKPAAKTDEMTQAVGVDESGGLWASGETELLLADITTEEETNWVNILIPENCYKRIHFAATIKPSANLTNDNQGIIIVPGGGDGYQSGRSLSVGGMCNKSNTGGVQGFFLFSDLGTQAIAISKNSRWAGEELLGMNTANGAFIPSVTNKTAMKYISFSTSTGIIGVGSRFRLWGVFA